jgi:hypothetical protein
VQGSSKKVVRRLQAGNGSLLLPIPGVCSRKLGKRILMRALRGVFLILAACTACFSDNSVMRSVANPARVFTAIFGALFVIAEIMELMAL